MSRFVSVSFDPTGSCPHCGYEFDPLPKGNRTCPECRESVRVRTNGNGDVLLLTDTQAEQFAAERDAFYFARDTRERAARIGVANATWDERERALAESYGFSPAVGDVFWGLANECVLHAAERGDWMTASRIYWAMAEHLQAEGRDFTDTRRESFRCSLRHAYAEAVRAGWDDPAFVILGVGPDDQRDQCRDQPDRRFTFAELMDDDSPAPHVYDDRHWCPCTAVPDWSVAPPANP